MCGFFMFYWVCCLWCFLLFFCLAGLFIQGWVVGFCFFERYCGFGGAGNASVSAEISCLGAFFASLLGSKYLLYAVTYRGRREARCLGAFFYSFEAGGKSLRGRSVLAEIELISMLEVNGYFPAFYKGREGLSYR
jgi:hypothetical protein